MVLHCGNNLQHNLEKKKKKKMVVKEIVAALVLGSLVVLTGVTVYHSQSSTSSSSTLPYTPEQLIQAEQQFWQWVNSLPIAQIQLWHSFVYEAVANSWFIPQLAIYNANPNSNGRPLTGTVGGKSHYSPPSIPSPGSNPNIPIGQLNFTIFLPHVQTFPGELVWEGFKTGVNPDPTGTGMGAQFIVDVKYVNLAPGYESIRPATWFWNNFNNEPVSAASWEAAGLHIGHENARIKAGVVMPLQDMGLGDCDPNGDYWRTMDHTARRGFIAFSIRTINGDCFQTNEIAVYLRAVFLTAILDKFEELNALPESSENPLGGHIGSDYFPGCHSDGCAALVDLYTGNPTRGPGVPADPRVRNRLWLNRDGAYWNNAWAQLKQVVTMFSGFSSVQLWGLQGQERFINANECPIAQTIRVNNMAHQSAEESSRLMALVSKATGNINGSFGWCDPGVNPTCIANNKTKGPGYPDQFLAESSFWEDVNVNCDWYQHPLWCAYKFLPFQYHLLSNVGVLLMTKGGTVPWVDPSTGQGFETKYDNYLSGSSGGPTFWNDFMATTSFFGQGQPIYFDGTFNIPASLPIPLEQMIADWIPFGPGKPTRCPS